MDPGLLRCTFSVAAPFEFLNVRKTRSTAGVLRLVPRSPRSLEIWVRDKDHSTVHSRATFGGKHIKKKSMKIPAAE